MICGNPVFYQNGRLYTTDSRGNCIPVLIVGGAGGGGNGRLGVIVQDEGVQVNGTIRIINFIGAGVTVTDAGGNKANVNIPGDGIQSLTTAQRLALVPTTALIVEDTDLDMYFKWSTVTNSWSPF